MKSSDLPKSPPSPRYWPFLGFQVPHITRFYRGPPKLNCRGRIPLGFYRRLGPFTMIFSRKSRFSPKARRVSRKSLRLTPHNMGVAYRLKKKLAQNSTRGRSYGRVTGRGGGVPRGEGGSDHGFSFLGVSLWQCR